MSELGELGLSGYEEAAYRSLLTLGRATASDVADGAGVPRGRVYDVLNGLAARNLVRTHAASEPRRYEAVDPEVAVDRLLAERTRDLEAERERYESLADAASAELTRTLPVASQFWGIGMDDGDAVVGIREEFDRADERLWSVVGPPYEAAPVETYDAEVDAYADLVTDDLDVRLLTTPGALESGFAERFRGLVEDIPSFAVRTTPDARLSFDVIDDAAVCLTLPAPFEAGDRTGAVVVRDADLADAMASRFRAAWADATPVDPATADGGH